MFFAFSMLFSSKLLKINVLMVEAAGVEPETRVESTQVNDSGNA